MLDHLAAPAARRQAWDFARDGTRPVPCAKSLLRDTSADLRQFRPADGRGLRAHPARDALRAEDERDARVIVIRSGCGEADPVPSPQFLGFEPFEFLEQ